VARADAGLSIGYGRLAWLLMGLMLVRGWLVLAADPLLAVANNYDMIRVQACIDAFPDRPDSVAPASNSPAAPFSRFRFTGGVGASCFLTSEALFAWAAWPGMWLEQALRSDHSFSIRWKGGVQLMAWVALAVWCTRRLIHSGRRDLAAGHAAVCAIAVMDPGNTLYLNTFYSEASALLFLYAMLALMLVAFAAQRARGRGLPIALALSALLLMTSKFQHVLLPLIVLLAVLVAAGNARGTARPVALALLAGLSVGLLVQWMHRNAADNESIRHANVVDTLFTALLPNARDPAALLEDLGLPQDCLQQSGSSWYTPGMSERTLCPQVFAIDQRDLLRAALSDPAMSTRALIGGIAQMAPWIPGHLGVVEDQAFSGLPESVPSWSRVVDALGAKALGAWLFGLPMVALGLVLFRRSASQVAANVVVLAVSALPLCVLGAAVFGDGYADLARHTQLGIAALLAGTMMLGCLVADAAFRGFAGRR
jgi:hypothetical protein